MSEVISGNALCRCPCHQRPRVVLHVTLCCNYCPLCKQRIKRGYYQQHVKQCQTKPATEGAQS